MDRRTPRRRLVRALARFPYRDGQGGKGWFERFTRAQPHAVRRLALTLPGWPHWPRPLRVAFLADFHTGSHAGDVARLSAIVEEANAFAPDLALLGGDYMNLQPLGGGRVPPQVTAAILARLNAPCGRFAVLGNHDIDYGAEAVSEALRGQGIELLDDARAQFSFQSRDISIVGLSDSKVEPPAARALLADLRRDEPSIVLAHDPAWYARVTSPAHLTLAGHTHGGQIRFPILGVLSNHSRAPLRWSYGQVVEEARQLYVTSGLGTSSMPVRIGIPPEYVLLEINGPET